MLKIEASAVLLGACALITACANAPTAIRVNNAKIVNDDIAVDFVLTNIYRKPVCLSLESLGGEDNDGVDNLQLFANGRALKRKFPPMVVEEGSPPTFNLEVAPRKAIMLKYRSNQYLLEGERVTRARMTVLGYFCDHPLGEKEQISISGLRLVLRHGMGKELAILSSKPLALDDVHCMRSANGADCRWDQADH